MEISVIWSRRRDAWTYLRGADAREEKRGFSYRRTTRRKTRDPHTVTSRIPLAVNGRNLLSVCVCWRTNLRIRSVEGEEGAGSRVIALLVQGSGYFGNLNWD